MTIACAWCQATIREVGGKAGVSHGICRECRQEHFPETLRSVREQAAAIVAEWRNENVRIETVA